MIWDNYVQSGGSKSQLSQEASDVFVWTKAIEGQKCRPPSSSFYLLLDFQMKYRWLLGRTEAAGGRGVVAGGNKSPECGEAVSPIGSEGPLVSLMDVRLIYRRACQCQGAHWDGAESRRGPPTQGWNSGKKFWEREKDLRDRRNVNASRNCTFVCVTLVYLSVGTNREKVPWQPHLSWL